MNITVMSRSEAQKHRPEVPTWVISITDPFSKHANLRRYQVAARLNFNDATEGDLLMDDLDAASILRFVDSALERGVPEMVVHCEAGISRSAAVAAALERIYSGRVAWANKGAQLYVAGEGMVSRFRPNPYVYQMLTGEALVAL